MSATRLKVSPLSSIRGFNSLADFPKICIAIASRSVSFDILPRAAIASANTSSWFLKWPLESSISTPKVLKASPTFFEPCWADNMDFFILVCDFAMVSTDTSTRSAAALYFCSSCVDIPVTFARVLRSSAAFPDLYARPAIAASIPAAAAETPRRAFPADSTFEPKSFIAAPARPSVEVAALSFKSSLLYAFCFDSALMISR